MADINHCPHCGVHHGTVRACHKKGCAGCTEWPRIQAIKSQRIAQEVLAELENAMDHFAPMHSAHEGYAVILEELQELWDEIRLKTGTPEGQRKEAVQVAAMAIRFIYDISDANVEKD